VRFRFATIGWAVR